VYDTGGRPYIFTSYDAASGGNIVNQVQQLYNGLGQLVGEYQSHARAVDPATTPEVQYAYSEMAGGANHSRLISMTYPNGRVINYNYAPGVDDAISRLTIPHPQIVHRGLVRAAGPVDADLLDKGIGRDGLWAASGVSKSTSSSRSRSRARSIRFWTLAEATLYAAIVREPRTKKDQTRFRKIAPGRYARA
jgi:hypothetical protein